MLTKTRIVTIEAKINEMLKENTGVSFLDSGDAYGRHWQKNQNRDFKREPACFVKVYKDYVEITYNIYHYLVNHLDVSEKSEKIQRQFESFCNRKEYEDKSWPTCMEGFLDWLGSIENDFERREIVNTYNYDNLLSQILQYNIFYLDGRPFILLQIHGGCDVRGGYTKPYCFKLIDEDYFILDQIDVEAYCIKCKNYWESDNAGCSWYYNASSANEKPVDNYWRLDVKRNKVFCKECGGEIKFNVNEYH